jgi:energy-coupling factor transport system permease protein
MSMLGQVTIGQYVPGHSMIHRLDPRTKFITVFFFIIVIFLANNLASYLVAIGFVLSIILLSQVPFRFIWKGLKPVWLILLFTLIFHLWLTKGGEVIFQWGIVRIYEEGFRQGVAITIRIFLLVLITSLLTLTTKPLVLTDGLEKLMNPLKKIRFPAHEFALMISIALRFIPTLLQETEKIMKAQKARGANFTSGNIIKRAMHIVPILVPLFLSSFQRAEDLALAMEARGYRGGEGRTQLRQLSFEKGDYLAFVLTAFVFLLLAFVRSWSGG